MSFNRLRKCLRLETPVYHGRHNASQQNFDAKEQQQGATMMTTPMQANDLFQQSTGRTVEAFSL
jgi:hypothetical protein